MSGSKNQRDAGERERRNAEYKRNYPTAFPRLSEKHLAIIEEFAKSKTYRNGEKRNLPVAAVFSFIGAKPYTDRLPDEIETDKNGFVCTGPQVAHSPQWKLHRQPFFLETSRVGIFAAGDVRAASVKRVASAVGEGSMAVQFVHEYLKEI